MDTDSKQENGDTMPAQIGAELSQARLLFGNVPFYPMQDNAEENKEDEDESDDKWDAMPSHHWTALNGPAFQTRIGPNYKSGQKAASSGSIYDVVVVNTYKSDKKVLNIARLFDWTEHIDDSPPSQNVLPKFLVFAHIFPNFKVSLFGRDDMDGPSASIICLCRLNEEIEDEIIRFESSGSEDFSTLSPCIRLFSQWLERAPGESPWRNRLKAIPKFRSDMGKLGFNTLVATKLKKLTRPVLAAPAMVTVHENIIKGQRVVGVDFDGHVLIRLTRQIAYSIVSRADKIVADWGLVIEGRNDEELPERMLLAFQMIKPDLTLCEEIPLESFGEELISDPTAMPPDT